MRINFINKTDKYTKEYESLIRKVLKGLDPNYYFNLIFVSSDEIHEINKNYRGIDRVTDVITFALKDDLTEEAYADNYELGDVFLCLDKAISQANEYGHSVSREVGFLACHGYLHLKGYDHQTPEEEKVMFGLQEKILNKSNLKREGE